METSVLIGVGVVDEMLAFLEGPGFEVLFVPVSGADVLKLRTTRKEAMIHFASGANSRMLYFGKRYRSPFEPVNSMASPMIGCGATGAALIGLCIEVGGVPNVDGPRWKTGVPPSGGARAALGVPVDAG